MNSNREIEIEPQSGTFPHPGHWTGCGGNIDGYVSSRGKGNCGLSCSNCGSCTHWTCCGDTNKTSTNCLDHIQYKQAQQNKTVFFNGTDGTRVAARELEGVDFSDHSSAYVLK